MHLPVISVVVTVYNSSSTLEKFSERLFEEMNHLGQPFEVVFVDDGSMDDSWIRLKEMFHHFENITIARLAANYGQLEATMAGISLTCGRYVITIDDDLQYDPADISRLYDYMMTHNLYLVYGLPENEIHGPVRLRLRNWLLNTFLGKQYTSSFKCFHRSIIIDENNRLRTRLHFEAFEKLKIDKRFRGAILVKKQRRSSGKSGYSFVKKLRILFRYAPEYFPGYYLIGYFTGMILLLTALVWLFTGKGVSQQTFHVILSGILGLLFVITGLNACYLLKLIKLNMTTSNWIIAEKYVWQDKNH